MFDATLLTLARPATWLLIAFDVVVTMGALRLGLNALELLCARLHPNVLRTVRIVWTALVLYVLLAILTHALNVQLDPLTEHGEAIAAWFRESVGRILAVLVLAFVAWNLVDAASARIVPANEFTRRTVRVETLKGVVESTLRVAIIVVAVVTILQNVGINASTLLAGVSVLGLAVSFGAQSLIKDVITGFFILLEDQYGVGDVVTVNGGPLSGGVERLNLRFTALRALDGTVHIIPNGQINTVSVMSKDWSRVVASVGLPPNADVNGALELLQRVSRDLYADPEWNAKFLEEPALEGVTTLTKDGFEVRALFKVLPKEQWALGREFNRRMKVAMDDAGLGGLRPQLMVLRHEPGEATATAALTPPAPAEEKR